MKKLFLMLVVFFYPYMLHPSETETPGILELMLQSLKNNYEIKKHKPEFAMASHNPYKVAFKLLADSCVNERAAEGIWNTQMNELTVTSVGELKILFDVYQKQSHLCSSHSCNDVKHIN